MEAIPIGIFWCIAVWALFKRQHVLLYLFFATMPLGSFAVIPTAVTGGLTLTATPVVALLLIVRELSNGSRFKTAAAAAMRPSSLLLLFIFWILAAITTAFSPRFFAGQIQIVPVRSEGLSAAAMLMPTAQNISQFVYISISVLTVFVFSRMLKTAEMRQHVFNALCLGGAITILTGLLDFASQYVSLQALLEVFRTASYALMTEDEVLDSKRVVGLMPEASAFGNVGLSYLAALYFFRRGMPKGKLRDKAVPMMVGLLALLVWLSTSSSAYLGLALFGATMAAEWFSRLVSNKRNPYLSKGLSSEFALGAIAALIVLLVFIAKPSLFSPIVNMIDVMVLQKSSSSSFEERGMWTQVSWDALLATYGLGVGLGGTRASNFAVALASNAGILGAFLYFTFAIRCLLMQKASRHDKQGGAILWACRWAYLPAFCAALTVGTTPDFGLFNAFIYGFALATATLPARKIFPQHSGKNTQISTKSQNCRKEVGNRDLYAA